MSQTFSLKEWRENALAKGVDKALEGIDKFLGPSGKAFLANGLDELAQVFAPGVEQIQPGNNPGLWGRPTTGEATLDRKGESKLDRSGDATLDQKGTLSLDEMRGFARGKEQEQTKEPEKEMER